MRKTIKNIIDKDYSPFIVLSALLFIFHIPLDTNFGDDLMFRAVWGGGGESVLPWLVKMWKMWSSRVLINFASVIFTGLPQVIWKIINVGMIILAAACVSKIFAGDNGNNSRRTRNTIVASLFMMYNLYEMSSTGWMTATINYLWPAALGLFALLSVKKALQQTEIKSYEYPLTIAALIFAANQEQVCAVLLAAYLSYALYAHYSKTRVNRFVLMQLLLCAASLIFIFSCPGNSLRYEAEMIKWFPGHDALSIFQKISIGVSSTLNYFVLTPNVLFITLTLLLSAGIFIKFKSSAVRIIALTPVLIGIISFTYVFFDFFMDGGAFALRNPRDIFHLYGILGTQSGLRFYIPHILYTAMICSFAACLHLFFRNTKKVMLPFYVLLMGISSRVMLGLSPTVFASSYRTYLLLNLSFIIAALLVYRETSDFAKPKTLRYINVLIITVALINFLSIPIGYEIVKPFLGRL